MGAAEKLDSLVDRAAGAARLIRTEREEARAKVVSAMRALEQRIQLALAGEPLRGLKNVAGDRGKFVAARVSGGVDAMLPYSGEECLVLGRDGVFHVARVHGDGYLARRARDEDLVGKARYDEHLGCATAVAVVVLERHLLFADRRLADFARCSALADRLRAVVG